MTCEEFRDLFPEAYYHELDENRQRDFERHRASCADCAAAYGRWEETLGYMRGRAAVDPEESFSAGLWDRLEQTIEAEAERKAGNIVPFSTRRRRFASLPAWSYAVAATIFVALGIYLGKTFFATQPRAAVDPNATEIAAAPLPSDTLATRQVQQEVRAYLDRSRALLLGVIHSPDARPSGENFVKQQQLSRDLLRQASVIESKLQEPDRERFRQLIGDLGVILRELANYSRESGVPLIELVRQGVDTKSILLKINLEEIRSLDAKLNAQAPRKSTDPKSKI